MRRYVYLSKSSDLLSDFLFITEFMSYLNGSSRYNSSIYSLILVSDIKTLVPYRSFPHR